MIARINLYLSISKKIIFTYIYIYIYIYIYVSANERESTFRVVDKYGPCFQPSLHRSVVSPSLTDIICSDRARIYSIQARLSKNSGRRDLIVEPNSLRIPVIDGSAFNTLSYLVKVGFGTPKTDLSLILDTGSRLTWTQCEPCRLCYKQKEPLFDRDDSNSYVSISRTDPVCAYVRHPGKFNLRDR